MVASLTLVYLGTITKSKVNTVLGYAIPIEYMSKLWGSKNTFLSVSEPPWEEKYRFDLIGIWTLLLLLRKCSSEHEPGRETGEHTKQIDVFYVIEP